MQIVKIEDSNFGKVKSSITKDNEIVKNLLKLKKGEVLDILSSEYEDIAGKKLWPSAFLGRLVQKGFIPVGQFKSKKTDNKVYFYKAN